MREHKPAPASQRRAVDPIAVAVANSQAPAVIGERGFDPAIEHALDTQQPLDEEAYTEPPPWWRRLLKRGSR